MTGWNPKNVPPDDFNIDINYSVMCLNREQGIQWIKKERLPAFLKSDCYFEYRLARLLSQVRASNSGMAISADPNYQPWEHRKEMGPSLTSENEDQEIMKKFFVTLGQVKSILAMNSICLMSDRVSTLKSYCLRNDGSDEYPISIADSPSPTPLRLYIAQKTAIEEQQNQKEDGSQFREFQDPPVFPAMDDFLDWYVQCVMKSAILKLTGEQAKQSDHNLDIHTLSAVIIRNRSSGTPSVSSMNSQTSIEEEIMISDTESDEPDAVDDWCLKDTNYRINSPREFEKFKSFLKGTPGEKLLCLWLDIERLNTIKNHKNQRRHLSKMKKMITQSDHFTADVLLKLELDRNQWSRHHLQTVQCEVVKPLLLYWGPRFCISDTYSAHNAQFDLKSWSDRQLRPKRDADPFAKTMALLPLRPKSCAPRISSSVHHATKSSPPLQSFRSKTCSSTKHSVNLVLAHLKPKQTSRSLPGSATFNSISSIKKLQRSSNNHIPRSPDLPNKSQEPNVYQNVFKDDFSDGVQISILKSSEMALMLQALYLDSRAGYFFTSFCEKSGNKLWENGIYFWSDLQSYHHMFYQETLQPFQLRRHSHFLFGTYLAPSASMDIGVEQNIKKEIYQKLYPPFEDLFDSAEEYILTLLLSAWTKMTESDRQAYRKVELVEEPRQLESDLYRKLQALRQKKMAKKVDDQPGKSIFLPPPDIAKEQNLWELVPEDYRNYNLISLVRHRMELEHFRTFLEDNFSSQDLMCWIDLEQLRRIPHKEREKRQEKVKDIRNKYINKKYFFGPNSPATRDQQEQVIKLAGGWGKILQDKLPAAVLIEVQKYVRMRIEKKWLPMFLTTEAYRERQKLQGLMKDVAEDVIFQTNKKKMGVWKHLDNKWISSSKEIIAFRKALLNPVTANQFQRFITLKGDFLENGMLFWLEVQKYKGLCHSHCDDATIQNKITAIINCFINSSIPPALQIDIPQEQADEILERRWDLGPYVFHEAQMTIFSILFKFWPEFCEFRSQLSAEKILPFLERKKLKLAEAMKRKVRDEERFVKHQEEAKRKGTLADLYGDNESTYSEDQLSGYSGDARDGFAQDGLMPDVFGRSKCVTWSYSKYIDALEKERMLLKVQEDLERNMQHSISSDNSSVYGYTRTVASGRTNTTSRQAGPTEQDQL
ncbi:hypothetical protein GDO86_010834 [Hymenochirus boettgeri]|uniref:RGS domain-containing protein n=1 Tax=Hymenochirus boettgeri TaxID=247094 RepID=A0A8T2JDV9_9PIPI|nr:hypothetical protein GDO86_010834 [Hymenochirus boettgeri]